MANNYTTSCTTRVERCEVCDAWHANWYGFNDNDEYHIFCDQHKKEYDTKIIMKLRKEKLNKITK